MPTSRLALAASFSLALSAAPLPLRAAPGAQDSVGLYPLQLPQGQEALQGKLAAQLHDGAASLPGVRAFDLIAKGVCAPDEGGCLADAARAATLDLMVSVDVAQREGGYRFHVRAFAARDAALRGEEKGEVTGGPLDLASALEHGVCTALGAAPCAGALRVTVPAGDSVQAHLFVDGADQGALPLAKPLPLPVGRHLVRAGESEKRVRVSYAREAKLVCATRAGQAALLDEGQLPAAPEVAVAIAAAPAAHDLPRARVARVLLASGAALVLASAGLELYARTTASQLDARFRTGQLTDADAARYGSVHTAGSAALVTFAAGLGALTAGAIYVAVTPGGFAAVGRF